MKNRKKKKQNNTIDVLVLPKNIESFTDRQELLNYLQLNTSVYGYAVAELITKKGTQ